MDMEMPISMCISVHVTRKIKFDINISKHPKDKKGGEGG
jgi:hypothetical protein